MYSSLNQYLIFKFRGWTEFTLQSLESKQNILREERERERDLKSLIDKSNDLT